MTLEPVETRLENEGEPDVRPVRHTSADVNAEILKKRPSRRLMWGGILVFWVANTLLEMPILASDLFEYFGRQPLDFWATNSDVPDAVLTGAALLSMAIVLVVMEHSSALGCVAPGQVSARKPASPASRAVLPQSVDDSHVLGRRGMRARGARARTVPNQSPAP